MDSSNKEVSVVFLRAACLIFGLVVFIGRARHKGLNYPLDTKFLTTSIQNWAIAENLAADSVESLQTVKPFSETTINRLSKAIICDRCNVFATKSESDFNSLGGYITSRRDILKSGAVALVGLGAVYACAQEMPQPKFPSKRDKEVDAVIAESGIAGISAAI